MRIPTAIRIDPRASTISEQLASVPPTCGIYALFSESGPPYLSSCSNLRKRLNRLLIRAAIGPEGLLARLRTKLASVEFWTTGSRLEAGLFIYELARAYFPDDYLRRLKLRMPWFLGLTAGDEFPRFVAGNRIPRNPVSLIGPFSSRDAVQQYEQEVSGLFQIRRCTETLMPHPDHPGCIYGEMSLCLRPCQCAVTAAEYETEVHRVREFLSNNGRSAIAALSTARDRAANETDFEQAAFLHRRLEKIKTVAALRDEVVSQIHQFSGVALTRGTEPRQFRLWPMLNGYWQEPLTVDFAAEGSPVKSLDHELRLQLNASAANARSEGNRLEHLAIFSRWYYSSWRDGHWFPFLSVADLNYRKLVREISRLVKADSSVPAP